MFILYKHPISKSTAIYWVANLKYDYQTFLVKAGKVQAWANLLAKVASLAGYCGCSYIPKRRRLYERSDFIFVFWLYFELNHTGYELTPHYFQSSASSLTRELTLPIAVQWAGVSVQVMLAFLLHNISLRLTGVWANILTADFSCRSRGQYHGYVFSDCFWVRWWSLPSWLVLKRVARGNQLATKLASSLPPFVISFDPHHGWPMYFKPYIRGLFQPTKTVKKTFIVKCSQLYSSTVDRYCHLGRLSPGFHGNILLTLRFGGSVIYPCLVS